MKKLAIVFSALALIWACSPKTTSGIEPIETEPAKELSADAMTGKALYDASCGRCHDLPEIPKYSQERWQKIIPPMSQKAKLDAEQEKHVTTYVMEMLQN